MELVFLIIDWSYDLFVCFVCFFVVFYLEINFIICINGLVISCFGILFVGGFSWSFSMEEGGVCLCVCLSCVFCIRVCLLLFYWNMRINGIEFWLCFCWCDICIVFEFVFYFVLYLYCVELGFFIYWFYFNLLLLDGVLFKW